MPVKVSVALAIRHPREPAKVLLVRRPNSDDEFPGMWGLPAASCKGRETPEDAAYRAVAQKLGCTVRLGRILRQGFQERPAYTIEMTLFEAWLDEASPSLPDPDHDSSGATMYTDWRWDSATALRGSAAKGSLCSQLLLEVSTE